MSEQYTPPKIWQWQSKDRPRIVQTIAEAREQGDLK